MFEPIKTSRSAASYAAHEYRRSLAAYNKALAQIAGTLRDAADRCERNTMKATDVTTGHWRTTASERGSWVANELNHVHVNMRVQAVQEAAARVDAAKAKREAILRARWEMGSAARKAQAAAEAAAAAERVRERYQEAAKALPKLERDITAAAAKLADASTAAQEKSRRRRLDELQGKRKRYLEVVRHYQEQNAA